MFGMYPSLHHQLKFESTKELKSLNGSFKIMRNYLSGLNDFFKLHGDVSRIHPYKELVKDIDVAIRDFDNEMINLTRDRYDHIIKFVDTIILIFNKHRDCLASCNQRNGLIKLATNIRNYVIATNENRRQGIEISSQTLESDFEIYEILVDSILTQYLRQNEYLQRKEYTDANQIPNAYLFSEVFYSDRANVCRLTLNEIKAACQSQLLQLDYFAFHLLESKQKSSNLAKLNSYHPSTDVDAQKQLGLIHVDSDGQWTFSNDELLQYFAARYLAACIQAELQSEDENKILTYSHRWICSMSIQEYVSENIKDEFHQSVLSHVKSMLNSKGDGLAVLWCDNPQMSKIQILQLDIERLQAKIEQKQAELERREAEERTDLNQSSYCRLL